jgi:hypothetical protein
MPERPSLVLELQRLASVEQTSITELLNKALVVASKLKVADFKKWVEEELNGYVINGDVPPYRQLFAEVKAFNPYNGWIPVHVDDPEISRMLTATALTNSAPELEKMASAEPGSLQMDYAPELLNMLVQLNPDFRLMRPRRIVPVIYVVRVLAVVRKTILQWALKLEEEGILGEGMSFSADEKQKAAAAPNIHIGNIGQFTGNLGGNISGETVQIGNYSSIHEQLKDAGIPQAERNQLEDILDALKKAKPENKPPLLKQGMEWVDKNKVALGTLAVQLTAWFTGQHHQ